MALTVPDTLALISVEIASSRYLFSSGLVVVLRLGQSGVGCLQLLVGRLQLLVGGIQFGTDIRQLCTCICPGILVVFQQSVIGLLLSCHICL